MDGQYLIPANTKNGTLIFNLFRPIDLIIFGIGAGTSLLCFILGFGNDMLSTIVIFSPAVITGMLVTKIPNYHNILVVISEAIMFVAGRQRYIWKGWCYRGIVGSNKTQK